MVKNRPSKASKVPWGFAGMLALVAAVEWGHAWQRLDVPEATDDWVRNQRIAARYVKPCDVLCLGDSALKFGVAPTVIEGRTGLKCYNLAVLAGSPVTSYVLFREAIEAGARPSAIVVESLPHVLALDPRARSQKRWPRLLTCRDAWELATSARDPSILLPYLVDRLLPTSRERETLRLGIMTALKGETLARGRFFAFHTRNWDQNRGAQLLQVVNNPIHAANDYLANYPHPWSCDPVNAQYVNRLLDLAASRGVKVYWFLPPIDPEVQALCDANGQDTRFDQFLRETIQGRPGVEIVDARRAGFDRAQFVDWAHVNRLGAIALSEALAAEMSADRAAPRPNWVHLPRLRDRKPSSPSPAIEDLDQSRIAIESGQSLRR